MICKKCKQEIPDNAIYCHLCGKKQTAEKKPRRRRANGTGTIYKMPGNRSKPYCVQKNHVTIGTYVSYTDAQKALERLTDTNITGKYNLTIAQIYDRWSPAYYAKKSKTQQQAMKSAYNNCAQLHDRKIRDLSKSDYQACLDLLEASGKSESTCDKLKQLFGHLNRWAMDEQIIQRNASENCTVGGKETEERKIFTADQIEAIRNSGMRGADIALILIACGCRPVDLFRVKTEDCYEDYFISGSKTATGRNRLIFVANIGLAEYQALRNKAIEKGYDKIILAYDGNRTQDNYADRDFRDIMISLGMPDMTPYNCRHTYTTMAKKSGVDPNVLARQLGHKSPSVTEKWYTHRDIETMRQMLAPINDQQGPE